MPISKFKATCLAVLEQVRKTRTPVTITKHGVPVAQVIPPPPAGEDASWLGTLAGTLTITGDIISPASDETEWEAAK